MGKRPVTNCSNCAYVQNINGNMWCPFHDVQVNGNLVCDDFLDEYDSPQWKSLTDSMTDKNSGKSYVQYTKTDLVMYISSGIFMLGALFFTIDSIRRLFL